MMPEDVEGVSCLMLKVKDTDGAANILPTRVTCCCVLGTQRIEAMLLVHTALQYVHGAVRLVLLLGGIVLLCVRRMLLQLLSIAVRR